MFQFATCTKTKKKRKMSSKNLNLTQDAAINGTTNKCLWPG
jgi:hypothetical protein